MIVLGSASTSNSGCTYQVKINEGIEGNKTKRLKPTWSVKANMIRDATTFDYSKFLDVENV